MRFEEVFEWWTEKRLSQQEAATLLGICDRQFRRQCRRYESDGLEGLIDQRLGQVSARRAPVDEVLRLVEQYRGRYVGWTVKHFYSEIPGTEGSALVQLRTLGAAAGTGGSKGAAARCPSPQAGAQTADRHDVAPGRLAL